MGQHLAGNQRGDKEGVGDDRDKEAANEAEQLKRQSFRAVVPVGQKQAIQVEVIQWRQNRHVETIAGK